MSDDLKTGFETRDVREILQSPPSVLLGVSQDAADLLGTLEIKTVFDLASSRLFGNASRLLRAGLDPRDVIFRHGAPPADVVRAQAADTPIDALRFEDIRILEGVSQATAQKMRETLHVDTIRDLALWPPYQAAQRLLRDAYFPSELPGFDPEAPADLLPKSGEFPTERVFYQTLLLDQVDADPTLDLATAGPIDIAPTLSADFGFKSLGVGALVTVAQSWYAKGVALGQLLHSTTLAPGESTRIAMMDWSRRSRAGTTESISETEQLDNETMHGRSLSEVTNAVAREAQEGFSSTSSTSTSKQKGTTRGSATINADPLNTLTLGLFGDDPGVSTGGTSESESTVTTSGMTFTSSSGQREVAASVNQQVMDRTQQHANAVRNRRASIVREVSQEEHQSVSTRVVTNYNHMHALSIQYYEVVQIYRVEVGVSKVDKCLFVPMKLVDFTQAVLDKYRLVLANAALDRNIRELLTTRYGVVELAPQTPKISVNTLVAKAAVSHITRATLREDLFDLMTAAPASIPSPQPEVAAKIEALPEVKLSAIRPSILDVVAAKGYDIAQIDAASKLLGRPLIRAGSDSVFLPDDTIVTGLVLRAGTATKLEAKVRGEDTRVGVGTDGVSLTRPLQITDIESIFLTNASDKDQLVTLQLQCSYYGVFFPFNLKVRLGVSAASQEVIRFGGVRAARELLDHLNSEKLHYSQALYRSLDASSLALLLSPYRYQDKPVVQLIDPTPITLAANYLVFRMHEEEFETRPVEGSSDTPPRTEWGKWLQDRGIVRGRVSAELVPLPSGGVFAEAVLGRYNSAEKLDMTRFWNWQDSPIPIVAPEISPIDMASRAMAEDLKPGNLSTPLVNIVQPTALPDPTGMAAVLQAVQNGNMFRDMSGLMATMELAKAGMSSAEHGATAAGEQAGRSAQTAANLFSDLMRTAATVASMGVGGAAGAAGGLLSSSANKGAGGNISTAGALLNEAKAIDAAGPSGGGEASPTDFGGGGAADAGGGASSGGTPTGGGMFGGVLSGLTGSGLGGTLGALPEAFRKQVMSSSIWGAAGGPAGGGAIAKAVGAIMGSSKPATEAAPQPAYPWWITKLVPADNDLAGLIADAKALEDAATSEFDTLRIYVAMPVTVMADVNQALAMHRWRSERLAERMDTVAAKLGKDWAAAGKSAADVASAASQKDALEIWSGNITRHNLQMAPKQAIVISPTAKLPHLSVPLSGRAAAFTEIIGAYQPVNGP